MFNDFIEKINELYNIILQPIDNIYKKIAIDKYKVILKIEKNCTFSSKYYKIISFYKEQGAVYTPEEISLFIIKNVVSAEEIVNNPYIKIVDPACGGGNLIIPCFNYLRQIFSSNLNLINEKNNLKLTLIDIDKHIINNNLFGFDIDYNALKVLFIDLFNISGYISKKNFICKDFLIDSIDRKFDIFIANPPYVGHKSVNRDYSKILKEKYKDIYKDKGDISYCFLKMALDRVKEDGKISFITSRYFLESPSGEFLRKMLTKDATIYKIVDFYGIRPFKGVGIDPVIIFFQNKILKENEIEIIKPLNNKKNTKKLFCKSVFFNQGKEYKKFFISNKYLNDSGWRLIDERERNIIKKIEEKSFSLLGEICDTYQGIITGCDKAFVINKDDIYKQKIELDIIRPWIKSSFINKNNIVRYDKFIIYSNLIKCEKEYPNAINYIKKYKEKLLNRRECKKGMRLWYQLQWGRVQEIFENEKIIFPYKSSNNRFVLDKGSYFSADVYAIILKEDTIFSYDYLLYILNSKIYEFYFKTFGKKLGEDLFEYYPNNLNKLCIPFITNYDGKKDDWFLYNFFELNEEEIKIVEDSFPS